MATKAKNEARPSDPRGKIVDALMKLAGERQFEDISIRDICDEAGVTLAEFRDCFPSKGAVLAGFSRRIDRAVLTLNSDEFADENPRERLFDVLMRRLEAMAPYREGLKETNAWLRREPSAMLAMNQVVTRIDALHARSGGDRVRGRRSGSDQASGPGARLGADRRGVAGRRRPRPVEDDGRA